jgi:hypothetical protein
VSVEHARVAVAHVVLFSTNRITRVLSTNALLLFALSELLLSNECNCHDPGEISSTIVR